MNKKDSPFCDFRYDEEDSNEHMLIECKQVQEIWRDIETWILEIGVLEYVINEEIITFGEMQKAHLLNAVILITKKVTFNAKTNMSTPSL